MRRKFLILLTAAISFIALPAFGSTVTVKGHALKDISDIAKTASGKDLEIQKHSIMFFERFVNGGTVHFQPKIFTINSDGSLNKQYTLSDYTVNKSVFNPSEYIVQKIELAVSDKRFGDSRNVMITNTGLSNGSYGNPLSFYGVKSIKSTIKSNNVTLTNVDASYQTTDDSSKANVWGTGHLGIKGIDKDVFVYVSSQITTYYLNREGSLVLSFVTADRSEGGKVNLQTLQVNNNGLKDRFEILKDPKHINVAIATGDIDNDGYKNEIALFVNRSPYGYSDYGTAYIYSVSSPDGKNLKLNLIKSQSIYEDCDYRANRLSQQACPNVLVGDFDGDGRNEAAFIARITDYHTNDIRVGILKFDEAGNWQYRWSNRDSTHIFNSFIGPVKAVKGDFDGDWKDEIVILSFIGNDMYSSEEFYLEHWYCDKGSIYPRFNLEKEIHIDAERLSNLDYTYYAVAEEASITAGPLTGRLGKATLVDDIAISYVYSSGSGEFRVSSSSKVFVFPTKLNSSREFQGFGDAKNIYADSSSSYSSDFRRGAIITSDIAEEILKLDKPVHSVAPEDISYQSVIQAFPYHVDNISEDGKSLTSQPINYTFSALGGDGKMSAQYVTSDTSSETSSAKFNLESTTETIIGLDKLGSNIGVDNLGQYAHGYLKFHQMQANLAAEADERAKAAAGVLNTVMDLVTDKIETTETEVNKTASSTTLTTGEEAYTHDNIVYFSAPQHIWRYKILNDPVPSWFTTGGRVDQNDDFGKLNVSAGKRYLTFSIYDGYKRTNSNSLNMIEYQPTHEEGNFFSYPSALTDIEGYNTDGELLTYRPTYIWGTTGSNFLDVTFQKTTENTTQSTKKVTESELSNAISVVGSWFGNDNPLDLPPYTSSTSTFSKTYTSKEEIKVGLQGSSGLPISAAGHTLHYMPYVTKEGTMKFGTAVTLNNTFGAGQYQTLWTEGSIYNQSSDPSLVLPGKFVRDKGTNFKASPNDKTATMLRGIRFYMPDLALKTDNKLVKGIPYKIKVPIYNASFVDANNVKVRLSYILAKNFNPNIKAVDSKLITVIGTTTLSLKGWKDGSTENKGWAEFSYTFPVNSNLKSGTYEFYVEIDPSHEIQEVHESRFNTAGTVTDVGGNNEGHFPFELWGFDDRKPTKNVTVSSASDGLVYSSAFDVKKMLNAGEVKASYGTYDTTDTIAIHLTFDGDETTKTMFDKLRAQASIDPEVYVPIEVEMDYMEDGVQDAYPEVILYAYNSEFTEESLNELFEKFETMTDEEIEEYFKSRDIDRINNGFVRHNASLFPGETTKFTIHLRPSAVLLDDKHVPIFEVYIPALAPELNISAVDVEPEGRDWGDFQYSEASENPASENLASENLSSGGGGCDVGFPLLALSIVSGALLLKRKSK